MKGESLSGVSAYRKEKPFRSLELFNTFNFLSKPGRYGKLFKIYQSVSRYSLYSQSASAITSCAALDK